MPAAGIDLPIRAGLDLPLDRGTDIGGGRRIHRRAWRRRRLRFGRRGGQPLQRILIEPTPGVGFLPAGSIRCRWRRSVACRRAGDLGGGRLGRLRCTGLAAGAALAARAPWARASARARVWRAPAWAAGLASAPGGRSAARAAAAAPARVAAIFGRRRSGAADSAGGSTAGGACDLERDIVGRARRRSAWA